MFTVDIAFNDKPLRRLSIRNLGPLEGSDENLREYEYTNMDLNEAVRGKVRHNHKDGIEILLMTILGTIRGVSYMKLNNGQVSQG